MREPAPTLLRLILSDFWNHQILAVLFMCILSSSLALVYTTHQTRLKVAKHDVLMAERDKLNIEWRHLKIESDTLTEHSRIQYIAEHKLNMLIPNDNNERVVMLP